MYHKWQSYDVWFLKYGAWQTYFFVILDHFLHFYPLTTQKIKILIKMIKLPGDMIIFHMCTINDIHMMYGFWDMKCDEQNFLSFWTIFFPFYPPNNPKNPNFEELKKKKTPGDIIILQKCTKNHDQMLHCSFDMANNKYNYYFSFWAIFCPFNSLTAQKIKI